MIEAFGWHRCGRIMRTGRVSWMCHLVVFDRMIGCRRRFIIGHITILGGVIVGGLCEERNIDEFTYRRHGVAEWCQQLGR